MRRYVLVGSIAALVIAMLAPPAAGATPTCGGRPATIVGTTGDDRLVGTGGDDVIVALRGADRIESGAGADLICGNTGADIVYAGPGPDRVFGGPGNDTIGGQDQADQLLGGDGTDRIYGAGGDDVVYAGAGFDRVHGGMGNDRLGGQDDGDWLSGESGMDRLYGGDGHNALRGDDGNDYLVAGDRGSSLWGGAGDDLLRGSPGGDHLYGEAGGDRLYGGAGKDEVLSGPGDDRLFGGTDNDLLKDGIGLDYIDGREGVNTIVLTMSAGRGAHLDLAAAQLTTAYGVERVFNVLHAFGSAGDDVMLGSGRANRLTGAGGNDRIEGRAGDDILYGLQGADTILGGDGNDQLDAYAPFSDGDVPFPRWLVQRDVLRGNDGDDHLVAGGLATGGRGDDRFEITDFCWEPEPEWNTGACYGQEGASVVGGDGTDTLAIAALGDLLGYDEREESFVVDLPGDRVENTVSGEHWTVEGVENVSAPAGDDTLYGTAGPNTMLGGNGEDTIFGRGGDDHLHGGYQRNGFWFDDDRDTMRGGTAVDTCYTSGPPHGTGPSDTITCEVVRPQEPV